jgi:hypothetical protein
VSETVRVALTVEQRADKADEIARHNAAIIALEAEKDAASKRINGEIKGHEADINRLCYELREGGEFAAQMELFATEEAAKQLAKTAAEIAARCTCPEGPEAEVKSPACPVHGVDAQPAKVPLCACGKPGSCIGHYDGDAGEGDQVACGDCCSHSQCDGHCKPLELVAASQPETPQEATDGAAAMSEPSEAAGEAQAGEAASEAPAGDEAEVDIDEKFPREDLDAAVAANTVDVGTVEEPPTVAAHRAKRRRTRLSEDDGPEKAA